MLSEFRGFLTKTNALALAVGVIIGAAVGSVVSGLAADILMPVIGLFLPGGGWRDARVVLSTATDASGKTTENAILYGHFLGVVLDFVIVALVVFFLIRLFVKPTPIAKPEPTKKCPECLDMIPAAARRCRACTAALSA